MLFRDHFLADQQTPPPVAGQPVLLLYHDTAYDFTALAEALQKQCPNSPLTLLLNRRALEKLPPELRRHDLRTYRTDGPGALLCSLAALSGLQQKFCLVAMQLPHRIEPFHSQSLPNLLALYLQPYHYLLFLSDRRLCLRARRDLRPFFGLHLLLFCGKVAAVALAAVAAAGLLTLGAIAVQLPILLKRRQAGSCNP